MVDGWKPPNSWEYSSTFEYFDGQNKRSGRYVDENATDTDDHVFGKASTDIEPGDHGWKSVGKMGCKVNRYFLCACLGQHLLMLLHLHVKRGN